MSQIAIYLRNVFDAGELERDSVVAKNAITAAYSKTYQVEFFIRLIVNMLATLPAHAR